MNHQPRALNLYTYYKVSPAQFEACVAASNQMLQALQNQYSLQIGLYQRADEQTENFTVMETVSLPCLSHEEEQAIVQEYKAIATRVFQAIENPPTRHLEQFVTIIKPVDQPCA